MSVLVKTEEKNLTLLSAVWSRVKDAVLTTFLIAGSRFNPHPDHKVASLNKTLYDDYICLMASNKHEIYAGRSQTSTGIRSTPKRVWICPK